MVFEKITTYIFVDESGDLGKHGSNYFVIACLSTGDPRPIERIVKKVRERRLKRKMREITELKANSSNQEIRIDVLKRLVKCECKIDLIIIDKKQVTEQLYGAKNKLYNYVFGVLVEEMDFQKLKIEIVIDKKDSNRLLREDLDQYIYKKIKETHLCENVKITHMPSYANKALQIVDFVAWAAHRKYSFNDDLYYKIIEPKIGTLKRLWKN
ncbi:MAG: DUF3800 domain-containing protein [Candidatus Diapherotrites archaeon]|nr:DUF3800 domain-containing protein [Candidatus Diapherotrites archaeon]